MNTRKTSLLLTMAWMLMMLLAGCGGSDDIPTPTPTPTPTTQKGYPTVSVSQTTVNVFGGAKVEVKTSQLLIGGDVVASWTDETTQQCKVEMKCNDHAVNNGDTLDEEGILTLTVTNNDGNSSSIRITLINTAVSTLPSFQTLTLQVDEEVDLMQHFIFSDVVTLIKTEVEMDGKRIEVPDPAHFTPEAPGSAVIVFTVQAKSGATVEVKFDLPTIQPMQYQAAQISNLQPKDILPIVGNINHGDKKAYEHIENLRIAEGTRIRDMMWKYGAGSHSASQYQALMKRLYTGMMGEKPTAFNNFEVVGEDYDPIESGHADTEWSILSTIIQHANMIVLHIPTEQSMDLLYQKQQNNAINLLGYSMTTSHTLKSEYEGAWPYFNIDKYIRKSNFLWFLSGGNIGGQSILNWNVAVRVYHEDIELPQDNHSLYECPQSHANGVNDAKADKHMILTVGTNKNGDVDITQEIDGGSGSLFPVGFHPDVLFSGRAFPFSYQEGIVNVEDGKYTTSFQNYTTLAMADLCFQMYAEVKDVDKLMSMIRATSLTNYIRLEGQTQNLHLINPAGFILKYLMPTVPTSLKLGATTELKPGYYHGVAFNIPGAEVSIDGEWMPFTQANQDRIKGKNPFNLKWRLNTAVLSKLGYKTGDSLKGQVMVIDDQWNGLNITQDVSIQIQ